MATTQKLALFLCILALGGCEQLGHVKQWALTPSSTPKKTAPVSNGEPIHESWCYRTLGDIDCYSSPQNNAPSTLVNVNPPSRLPMTTEQHAAAVAAAQGAAAPSGDSSVFVPGGPVAAAPQNAQMPVDITRK